MLYICVETGIKKKVVFRGALEKVFAHILHNAITFSKQGIIEWSCTLGDNQIEFRIADSGIGIDPALLSTIFEPFFQEDSGASRSYDGSGLGLMITKGFMELLGGEIRIDSEKDRGTCVTISLPIQKDKNQSLSGKKKPVSEEREPQPVVLIAEDDINNRLYLENLLQKKNFGILMACNGLEAVQLCKEHAEISMVFMDVKMPILDGLSATRLIRETRPVLPIIAVTAYGMTGDERMAREAGCSDYLTKPFIESELLETIGRALEAISKNQPNPDKR